MKHALERTSEKGVPFVGTCRNCGRQGLTMANFINEECENTRGMSVEDSLIEALSPTPEAKP